MPDEDGFDREEFLRTRRLLDKHLEDRYTKIIKEYGRPTAIQFYSHVMIDDHGTIWLGEWDHYIVQIQPMGMTNRLVMTPMVSPYLYDYGWDFHRGPDALEAALAWDPERQGEPDGFTRRIGSQRPAGQKAATEVPEVVKTVVRMLGLNPD